jgi:hypothetical protein
MKKWRYPLQLHIGLLFVLVVLSTGVIISGIAVSRSAEMLTNATDALFARISKQTVSDIQGVFAPGESAVGLLAFHPLAEADTLDKRLASLPILRQALSLSPDVASLFVGYKTGDFFMLRRLPKEAPARAALRAPEDAQFAVQSIEHPAEGPPIGSFIYFDRDLGEISRDNRPDYVGFDPRTRPWYVAALDSPFQIKTAPYVFCILFGNRDDVGLAGGQW